MTHASLFSGLGGFDLAAEWMGWENLFHCEIDEFNQRLLKYYWPNIPLYEDITETDFNVWRGRVSVLTGGFPCQPFSVAGDRKGTEDDRHLWPQMLRAIREIAPKWVVGENVRGILDWNDGMVFEQVQADLESEGYQVLPFVLPAAGVNAPHQRFRVWFVAYAEGIGYGRGSGNGCEDQRERELFPDQSERGKVGRKAEGRSSLRPAPDTPGQRHATSKDRRQSLETPEGPDVYGRERNAGATPWSDFPTVSPVLSADDGISDRLDGITFSKWWNGSIKGYGNAVVPQLVMQIFKTIEKYETLNK